MLTSLRDSAYTQGMTTTQNNSIQPNDLIVTIQIPKKFYGDHLERDCGEGSRIVHKTKSHYVVELNLYGYNDLLSDADFYTDNGDCSQDFGFRSAARACANAIRKACPNGFEGSAQP
jgi:hypothetical protein